MRERGFALAIGGEHEGEVPQQIHVRGPAAERFEGHRERRAAQEFLAV
jgi:hypothetical protein